MLEGQKYLLVLNLGLDNWTDMHENVLMKYIIYVVHTC